MPHSSAKAPGAPRPHGAPIPPRAPGPLPIGGFVAGVTDWSGFSARDALRSIGATPNRHELTARAKESRYDRGRFHNLDPHSLFGSTGPRVALQMALGREQRIPKRPLPVVAPDPAILRGASPEPVAVTWLGHSSTIVDLEGVRLLTDPVFADRVGPSPLVGPPRFHPLAIPVAELPDVDAVVISHDHYDHLDIDTVTALGARGMRFVTPLGVGAHLRHWGVPKAQITELDWWEETTVRGIRVVACPARHFSGRGPHDRMRTLWASFAFVGRERRVFFSGDTGYHAGFRTIGERLGPFDVVMLEVGAFHESWAHVHLGPDNARIAHDDLRGRAFLPIHWGTFPLGMHDWWEPADRVLELFGRSVPLAMPRVGQTIAPTAAMPTDPWWRPLVV